MQTGLDDLFTEESCKQFNLRKLRTNRGWKLWQIVLALDVDRQIYIDVEQGRRVIPEIENAAKKLLNSGLVYSPHLFLKVPEFTPTRSYEFRRLQKTTGNFKAGEATRLKFINWARGANGVTHYLFKDGGGSIVSFTAVQLTDYQIAEAKEAKNA